MLRSFRLSTALAVLAIAVMAGAVLVRVIRRPPPPSVVATVETGPAAATPVAKTGEPEPAAMRTASPDPSAAPSAPAPETNAVAGRETSASATTSATTRPTAGSGVLFQDNRPYQPQDPPAATDRPARPAPESSAPVQVKPAGAPPSLFEDGRNFARPAEAAPPAEVVAAVPARPAAATPSRFEDARGPIIGQQATTAAGEAASAQVASRPIAQIGRASCRERVCYPV